MRDMSLYVTAAEFKSSPTAINTAELDMSNVGNQAAQDAALTNVLRAASGWVNRILKVDTLEATTQTETKEVHVAKDGRLNVYPKNIPIISLSSVSYTLSPVINFTSIDLAWVQVYPKFFSVYQLNPTYSNLTINQQTLPLMYLSPYQRQLISNFPVTVQYTYTSGYFHSSLSGNVAAGATTINVKNALGLSAGATFTIYDGANTEDVTVASVSGNTVTLTSGLQYAHNSGVPCSAIPSAVKQATIVLASYIIKNRGSGAVITNELVAPGLSVGYNKPTELVIAKELLAPYARVVVN